MPLLFQNHSPAAISYNGKDVQTVFYNGTEVWSALPRKESLENMSWADISVICRAGLAGDYWQIGDTKCLVEGDASIQLQIIGIDHDAVTDAASYGREKAGLTLQMVQLPTQLNATLNGTNYAGTSWYHSSSMYRCTVRSTLFPSYFESAFPQALKEVVVPVDKTYILADAGTEHTISDTLFLASYNEIWGDDSSGFGSEGKQYAYFAQGGSKIKKNTSGTAVPWWTRSPTGSNAKFHQINASGIKDSNWVIYSSYSPPCLCI